MPLNRNADYLTEHGAHALKAKIESFWANRGIFPTIWIDVATFGTGPNPTFLYCVRSNLAALVLARRRPDCCALTTDEQAHLTPEQHWFLNCMSWSLEAQDRVAHGYEPSDTDAAYFQRQVELEEQRDRNRDDAQKYGDDE